MQKIKIVNYTWTPRTFIDVDSECVALIGLKYYSIGFTRFLRFNLMTSTWEVYE